MGSFSNNSKSEGKVKEVKKLIDENKLYRSIELYQKEIKELKDLKIEEQKEKDEVNYMKTLARYTTQDLEICVKECKEAIEKNPLFHVCNRLGACFFKRIFFLISKVSFSNFFFYF